MQELMAPVSHHLPHLTLCIALLPLPARKEHVKSINHKPKQMEHFMLHKNAPCCELYPTF